ncbi:MAG: zinc-binding dehydrogenase, partial [Candidatus Dormiibacterota bacterium]
MRAIVVDAFGPPDVLRLAEVPDPTPGAGEVVVDVQLAGITFVETQIRAGRAPNPAMLPTLPLIPGNGVGGAVREVGPGADRSLIGRRVVTGLRGSGGYAERAVAAATRLLKVPEGLSLPDATALLADGRTASVLVERASLRAGETVLVEAAAGGVGTLLLQLVHNAGARVVALARGDRKLAIARVMGAELAVDYAEDGWAGRVRDAVGAVDVVFDGVGGETGRSAFELLRAGGRHVAFGVASGAAAPIPPEAAAARGVMLVAGLQASPEELLGHARRALTDAAAG